MEEKESRFDNIQKKLTMFLDPDNVKPSRANNETTQMIMFKKELQFMLEFLQ